MLVIIHGWSDSSKSFHRLASRLVAEKATTSVEHVYLGDYVSMDDEVTFHDLVQALERAWEEAKLPQTAQSVDVIVHSTGGLVIRAWMAHRHQVKENPVRRLLMLAPANFGSGLAHKGRSFLGRIVKGFSSPKFMQTGEKILKGLELASPYTWDLAKLDRFSEKVQYGPGGVLCTVLVGNTGYSGISAAANENGSDGTVRVSTANLSPRLIEMDFATDPQKPTIKSSRAKGLIAFCRLNEENHSTIALKNRGPKDNPATFQLITEALKVKDDGFEAYCEDLAQASKAARKEVHGDRYRQGYQNTVVHLIDDAGSDVCDFFLEVFVKTANGKGVDQQWTKRLQERVVETVHTYSDNSSYRSILFNCDELDALVAAVERPVYISLTALPDLRENGNVGYSTFGYNDIGSIRLDPGDIQSLFQPDRTLLVELKIHREQGEGLFRLTKFSGD